MRMTPARRRAIIEATIDPIRPFRRGYARSKAGPFIHLCTVNRLLQEGHLRPVPQCGSLRLLTARAA
jgi:hypothetical protein